MKTIVNNVFDELIINKSRFIGFLYKVNSTDEINNILKLLLVCVKQKTTFLQF